jgi:hypothetical protein
VAGEFDDTAARSLAAAPQPKLYSLVCVARSLTVEGARLLATSLGDMLWLELVHDSWESRERDRPLEDRFGRHFARRRRDRYDDNPVGYY